MYLFIQSPFIAVIIAAASKFFMLQRFWTCYKDDTHRSLATAQKLGKKRKKEYTQLSLSPDGATQPANTAPVCEYFCALTVSGLQRREGKVRSGNLLFESRKSRACPCSSAGTPESQLVPQHGAQPFFSDLVQEETKAGTILPPYVTPWMSFWCLEAQFFRFSGDFREVLLNYGGTKSVFKALLSKITHL